MVEGDPAVKDRIPPWRWSLWGTWPPKDALQQRAALTDDAIRSLAERLAKQRPWSSAEANWLAAERALRQPWRPWIIQFSGDQERSGWDWAELILKVSVPILIIFLTGALNWAASERQLRTEQEQREDGAVTGFIEKMQLLLLKEKLNESVNRPEVKGVARALTLATLSQLKSEDAPERKRLVIRFLFDSGKPGNPPIFSLGQADLKKANLRYGRFIGTNFTSAELEEANLFEADLSGADLSGAKLGGAKFKDTICPDGKTTDSGC